MILFPPSIGCSLRCTTVTLTDEVEPTKPKALARRNICRMRKGKIVVCLLIVQLVETQPENHTNHLAGKNKVAFHFPSSIGRYNVSDFVVVRYLSSNILCMVFYLSDSISLFTLICFMVCCYPISQGTKGAHIYS